MKTCFLHLGFHKTATTSFQITCQKNQKILENNGIAYPTFFTKAGDISSNHTLPIQDIFEKTKRKHLAITKEGSRPSSISESEHLNINAWINLMKNDGAILISGEGILKMPVPSLKRLVKELNTNGFLIQPFASVRSPYAFINSALQNTIKNGSHHSFIGLSSNYPAIVNSDPNTNKLPSTLALLRKAEKIFEDRIKYYPFKETTRHNQGPVAFILEEILGVPLTEDINFSTSNESLNNTTTRLINRLNSSKQSKGLFNLRKLRKIIDLYTDDEKFLLTEDEFRNVKQSFDNIKQSMNSLLNSSYTDENIRFSDPIQQSSIDEVIEKLPAQAKKTIQETMT